MALKFLSNEPEALVQRLQLQNYLSLILASYVKPAHEFFLAHTDFHAANIFVDEEGNLAG